MGGGERCLCFNQRNEPWCSKVKSNRWLEPRGERCAAPRPAPGARRPAPGGRTHTSCPRCVRAARPSPSPTGTSSTLRRLCSKASRVSPAKAACPLRVRSPSPSQRCPARSGGRLPNINRPSSAPPETLHKLPRRRAERRRLISAPRCRA